MFVSQTLTKKKQKNLEIEMSSKNLLLKKKSVGLAKFFYTNDSFSLFFWDSSKVQLILERFNV